MKVLHFTTAPMLSNKAYEIMLSYRPYQTQVKICNCEMQECKGRFLAKVGDEQVVCLFELRRLNYKKNIKPVMEIIEERITL